MGKLNNYCVLVVGLLLIASGQARAGIMTVTTDTSWRSIGPEGNQEGTTIGSVGLAWEAANIGWNSSSIYDDSDGTDWHSAFLLDFDSTFNYIWSDSSNNFGATPSYFRTTFFLDGTPTLGLLDFSVDDDALIYLNGHLVVNDANNTATRQTDLDVSGYLLPGANLFAVKAHDSYPFAPHGFNFNSFALQLDSEFTTANSVPEPSSVVMLGGIALMLIGFRRRVPGVRIPSALTP